MRIASSMGGALLALAAGAGCGRVDSSAATPAPAEIARPAKTTAAPSPSDTLDSAPLAEVFAQVREGAGAISCTVPELPGGRSTCILTPATGYALAALTDNGADVRAAVAHATYVIAHADEDHLVVASFSRVSSRKGPAARGGSSAPCADEVCRKSPADESAPRHPARTASASTAKPNEG